MSPQPGISSAASKHVGRLLHGLLPLLAVLVPASILAAVGWLNWHNAWKNAETDMRRAAQSAAEYGQRAFESYGIAVSRVNEQVRGLTDAAIRQNELALNRDLQKIAAGQSQIWASYVVDREGFPLVASNLFPVPRGSSLADREYFQALHGPSPPVTHISRTFIGRFDGQLLFSVSRRRVDSGNAVTADGFDGVVLVSVSPLVLAEGLKRLLPTPHDRMAFMRTDGNGISTTGGLLDLSQPLPRVAEGSPFYDFAAKGVASAAYISSTAMAGSTSVLAMQKIAGFPIYAVGIRGRAEIVADFWKSIATLLGFGVPATLALLLLSLQVVRDQRRLAASNAGLRRANDLSSDRLDRAKRFGLVGTFEFDQRTGESRRSPEYMSVHGLPAVPTIETHDDWANRLHPDDRQRAVSELQRALSDDSGDTEYGQTYRIVTGAGEVRWIAARGEILRDSAGRVSRLLGAHVDVTPMRSTEIALAESDARLRLAQEAVGIGAWEWLPQSRMFRCSTRMLLLWGLDPSDKTPGFRQVLAAIHPDDRKMVKAAIAQMTETGDFRCELRISRQPAPEAESQGVWVAIKAKMLDRAPGVPRLMGVVYDITDRKRAEEMTILMAHEVEHRAKNALTVVSGLLRMTRADSAEQLAQVMQGRVRALGQTMALLGKERWKGAELEAILRNELQPFAISETGDGFVIDLDGPPVRVDVEAVQPLSMALHELVTNAGKYGALSVRGGSLKVTWRLEGQRVHLRWEERGGPTLEGAPARTGFGSRLMRMLFEGQIGGEIEKHWAPEGLVCEMRFRVIPGA